MKKNHSLLTNKKDFSIRSTTSALKIETLSKEERDRIVLEFNQTQASYSFDKTIYELFEERVKQIPHHTAIVFNDSQVTYHEFNKKSNQLARRLREKGIKANTIVAIMTERSCEMLIGIFAILKAGGAYLPLDPWYPWARKKKLLADSAVHIILTQNRLKETVPSGSFQGEVIYLEDKTLYQGEAGNLHKINAPGDLAYVIYTSGSTGQPKGVLIEHHSLVNRIQWMQKQYPIAEKDVLFQKTTFVFDVSVWELVWWSIQGAKVCILPPKKEHNPRVFVKLIEKHGITVMHFVPSVLGLFLDYIESKFDLNRLKSLRRVFASGEALSVPLVERFYAIFKAPLPVLLTNLYGPTEATIDVSFFDCQNRQKYDVVPIGKPIANTSFYIIDHKKELKPLGEAGELYVSGVGLARGYLNNPELTRERFVPNPFINGMLMYKTGDRAKWLPDGNIVFLDRLDNQVKVRGLRIELGEIEYHLVNHKQVKDAIVLVREDAVGNKYLCAYVLLLHQEEEKKKIQLKSYLSQYLPDYMIPSQFVFLEKFPLKINGKPDISGLPDPLSINR